jgi:predicted site-specific integrase-resolvase
MPLRLRNSTKGDTTVAQEPIELMSSAQVADALGVSTARIRRLSLDGRLPFKTTPLGRLYPRKEVEAIAAARSKENRRRAA